MAVGRRHDGMGEEALDLVAASTMEILRLAVNRHPMPRHWRAHALSTRVRSSPDPDAFSALARSHRQCCAAPTHLGAGSG
jgi:hypothetical protein